MPCDPDLRMQCMKKVNEWIITKIGPKWEVFYKLLSQELLTLATCQKAKVALFSFTRCNPITFSNKWNAFIPSRGNNLGSHIGSLLRSPLHSPPAAPPRSAIHSSQPLSTCLPDLSPSRCLLWRWHLNPGVMNNAPVLEKWRKNYRGLVHAFGLFFYRVGKRINSGFSVAWEDVCLQCESLVKRNQDTAAGQEDLH